MTRPRLPTAWPLAAALVTLAAAAGQDRQPPPDPKTEPEVITKPRRTLEDIEKAYQGMQAVKYEPPQGRWAHLPRTAKILKGGGEWRVVMLGDSIMNDISRSGWDLLLVKYYPNVTVRVTTVVRGSTGCWWYKEPGRVQKYVLDFKPDLVMIGGISERGDVDSIRDVVKQIRAGSPADVLLMTGPFGRLDPGDEGQWKRVVDPPPGDYRRRLPELAKELNCEFLDLQMAWGNYVRTSGKPVTAYRRDPLHANLQGEQIVGRILAAYFAPKLDERPIPK